MIRNIKIHNILDIYWSVSYDFSKFDGSRKINVWHLVIPLKDAFAPRIESLLHCLYVYFNHNFKKHLEFIKLEKFMESKSNKIFWNIKTKWIFMISLVKHVLMKMALDAPIITSTKSSLCLLIM